jgi:hypothetical protein
MLPAAGAPVSGEISWCLNAGLDRRSSTIVTGSGTEAVAGDSVGDLGVGRRGGLACATRQAADEYCEGSVAYVLADRDTARRAVERAAFSGISQGSIKASAN